MTNTFKKTAYGYEDSFGNLIEKGNKCYILNYNDCFRTLKEAKQFVENTNANLFMESVKAESLERYNREYGEGENTDDKQETISEFARKIVIERVWNVMLHNYNQFECIDMIDSFHKEFPNAEEIYFEQIDEEHKVYLNDDSIELA